MKKIDVIKLDTDYLETWRYQGYVIEETQHWILLEAWFDQHKAFYGLQLSQGDRFIEIYFRDRWFNIFEIYDQNSRRIKGWYCNIAKPAEINGDRVSYVDLALDLLVFPGGKQVVLDMDEFSVLAIDAVTRKEATAALKELRSLFKDNPNFQLVKWLKSYE